MIDKYFKKQLKELAPELLQVLKENGLNVAKYEKILQEEQEEKKRKKEYSPPPQRQKNKIKKQITLQRKKSFVKEVRRIQIKEDADDVVPLLKNASNIAKEIQTERREQERKRLETLNELTRLALTISPGKLKQAEQRREQARERQEIIDKVKRGESKKEVMDYWRAKMLTSIKEQSPYIIFEILVKEQKEK